MEERILEVTDLMWWGTENGRVRPTVCFDLAMCDCDEENGELVPTSLLVTLDDERELDLAVGEERAVTTKILVNGRPDLHLQVKTKGFLGTIKKY